MLRLKTSPKTAEDEYVAIPGGEPITILQVANENLPYGCQCPLCGGVFQIPQGILYKIEDDDIPDVDSDTEFGASAESMTRMPSRGSSSSNEPDIATMTETTETPAPEEE